jgi:MinD superfamily P-loop ATPase
VAEAITDMRPVLPTSIAEFRARESGDVINYGVSSLGGLDVARVRAGEERSVTVVVQAPSAIDEEGFKRAVVDALNESANRGTGGGGGLRDTAQVL